MRPTTRPIRGAVACLTALLLVLAGCSDDEPASTPTTTTASDDRSTTATSEGDSSFDRIPAIVEEVEPSVVTVRAFEGIGSGVVFDADGLIVTNDHVLEADPPYTVVFADGATSEAEVVARAPLLDLALLRVDRSGLPAATFAEELPRVGELAVAIGSPLGLDQTVTAGIVSGINRSVPGSAQVTQALVNLIQTDAPISPGNSGGALVNAAGEVIGVNVAYLPPTSGAESLGFAVPAAQVVDAVEELLETGTVSVAYIGVVPGRVTPQIAERFDLPATRGAVIAQVAPGGPADEAGLEPGDIVVGVGDEPVTSVEDFLGEIRRHDPGDTVEIEHYRGDEVRTTEVTLGDRPVE